MPNFLKKLFNLKIKKSTQSMNEIKLILLPSQGICHMAKPLNIAA